jgi:hypothetical protein
MKRNITLAGTGIAAVGLAIFSVISLTETTPSLYRANADNFDAPLSKQAKSSKGASEWWFNRVKDVNGNLDLAEMKSVADRASQTVIASQAQATTQATNWTELGPDNVGGRTRALLMDRNNSNHFFAGGVSGGLWESTDGCNSWQPCAGYWAVPGVNMNVTSIAQAPNGDIYVGTGEGLYYFLGTGAGGFVGDGIYKSTDGGATFTHLSATGLQTANNPNSNWAATNDLCVDPNNSNRIYAATNNGLRVSTDGGTTWNVAGNISGTADVTDVDMNGQGTIIACVGGKPWRSTDDGVTFSNVGTTAFGFYGSGANRTEVDFAPSDPNYVYAIVATTSDFLAGVYFSSNGGASWQQVCGPGNAQFEPFGTGQGRYDMFLEVNPFDKNDVIIGGVELWRFELVTPAPAAIQWERIALEFPDSPFNPWFVHSDKHALVFDPAVQGRWFVGTDGGVSRTLNDGETYQQMNAGYNVTQAYSIAFDHFDVERDQAMIGTQDNGTQFVNNEGNTLMSALEVSGGDGGHCEISALNRDALFATVYYGSVSRSNNRGGGMASFYDPRVSGDATLGQPGFASFVTPIRLWESADDALSTDSVVIYNGWQDQNKHVTDGTTATFSGVLSVPLPVSSPAAIIDEGSVKFYLSNIDSTTNDGNGNFSGGAIGSVDAQGNYTITWNTTPPANKVIRVVFTVTYGAGTVFTLNSNVAGQQFQYTTPTTITAGGTLKAQDRIQSHLALGFTGNKGVWVVKHALDFSTNPTWYKIGGTANGYSGTASQLTWSADGNILYVGTESGAVYRFSGIASITSQHNGDLDTAGVANMVVTCTRIFLSSNRQITGLDADPNGDRLIVSLGGYSSTDYVYLINNASTVASSANTSNGTNKTGSLVSLGGIPVYAACFDKYTPNRVLIGTEYGIYETSTINAAPAWSYAGSASMGVVAVDMIRQQRWDPWVVPNAGCFYAGTHGRGAWRDDSSWQMPTSIGGPVAPGVNSSAANNKDLRVFPNPVIDNSNVTFMMPAQGDVTVEIYDLNGKVVRSESYQNLQSGANTVQFGTDGLNKGTYLISVKLTDGRTIGTGRFLKMN